MSQPVTHIGVHLFKNLVSLSLKFVDLFKELLDALLGLIVTVIRVRAKILDHLFPVCKGIGSCANLAKSSEIPDCFREVLFSSRQCVKARRTLASEIAAPLTIFDSDSGAA